MQTHSFQPSSLHGPKCFRAPGLVWTERAYSRMVSPQAIHLASSPTDAEHGLQGRAVGLVSAPSNFSPGNVHADPLQLGPTWAERMPHHVAFILDGNYRWAQQQGIAEACYGHQAGVNNLWTIVERCSQLGIPQLTAFAFSAENWERSPTEVRSLLHLMERCLSEQLADLADRGIRLSFFGDLEQLPNSMRALITRAEHTTADNSVVDVSIALSYGGRQDLVQAARALAADVASGSIRPEDITTGAFEAHLRSRAACARHGPPDLLIRTSGEQRLSNFMLWDLAYAELHFSSKLWPAFSVSDFDAALVDFCQRTRRYGKRR